MNQQNNNRLVLLLIAGIPLTMVLAASWLWYFVAKGELDLVGMMGTANQGTLVQPPRQLGDVALRDETGAPFPFMELEPRWSLLVARNGPCDAACEELMYLTRQIHLSIGKDYNRLRRVFIGTLLPDDILITAPALSDGRPAPPTLTGLLEGEHRGLRALQLSTTDFAALFPERTADQSTWYLVDPRGWIMMSYTGEIGYKDVISDLKFLLKNSSN